MSQAHSTTREKRARIKSWLIVAAIVFYILLYGLIVFFAVGDKGPPGWDFGAIKDVPGESPYSTSKFSTDYLDE